jgi:AcrR family transcriptional regulator
VLTPAEHYSAGVNTALQPPARPRAAALAPDQRRRAIVEATLPLLLEHGPAVTTRQIAEASAIAEGTIFRVFADKDALLEAVVERALDTAPLERRLAEIDLRLPLAERLVAAVRALQERTEGVWQLTSNVGVLRILSARHGGAPRVVADLASLAALFEPDRVQLRYEPVALARRLRALATACTHPALTPERVEPEEIVSMFLDGVRA